MSDLKPKVQNFGKVPKGSEVKFLSNICFSYIAERRFEDPEIRRGSTHIQLAQ